jgi:hypothetical protein
MSDPNAPTVPKWLQIMSAIVIIVGAVYSWYDTTRKTDIDSYKVCSDALEDACRTYKRGRDSIQAIVNSGRTPTDLEVNRCFNDENSGLSKLKYVSNNKDCSVGIRARAVEETIIFYKTHINPDRYKNNMDSLKQVLSQLKK